MHFFPQTWGKSFASCDQEVSETEGFPPQILLTVCTESFSLPLQNLYRWAGVNALPTGYSLPTDTPSFQHAKHVQHIGSDVSQGLNPSAPWQ